MNPLTAILQRFKWKRKTYLHKPIQFDQLSFSYTCHKCNRQVHTTITWEEYGAGKVRELQRNGLCETCSK